MTRTSSRRRAASFSSSTKAACWSAAAPPGGGRDPSRWRRDSLGSLVCRALRGCPGPLCMEFDHVLPVAAGGSGDPRNCQVLQTTANRIKADTVAPRVWRRRVRDVAARQGADKKAADAWDDGALDAVEMAVYGDVVRYGVRFAHRPSHDEVRRAADAFHAANRPQTPRKPLRRCVIQ